MSCGFCKFHMLFSNANITENRLRFDKVTDSLKVGTFLRHSVHFASATPHAKRTVIITAVIMPLKNKRLKSTYSKNENLSSRQR